jgi:hypothetical protein
MHGANNAVAPHGGSGANPSDHLRYIIQLIVVLDAKRAAISARQRGPARPDPRVSQGLLRGCRAPTLAFPTVSCRCCHTIRPRHCPAFPSCLEALPARGPSSVRGAPDHAVGAQAWNMWHLPEPRLAALQLRTIWDQRVRSLRRALATLSKLSMCMAAA